MRLVLRIDEQGFFVEDVILKEGEEVPADCVENTVPQGLYRPRWNGSEWVEGLIQEEIDAISNQPTEPTELEVAQQEISTLKEEKDSLVTTVDFILTEIIPNLTS